MVRTVAVASLLACVCLGKAEADESRLHKTADCMFEHATNEDLDVLKNMIVAGIEEDSSSLKGLAMIVVGSVARLATVDCDYPVTELGTQEFKTISNLYGQRVGEKVMQDAFSRLNQ